MALTAVFARPGIPRGNTMTQPGWTSRTRQKPAARTKRLGWSVVQVFEDAGISGAKGRRDRPALDVCAVRVRPRKPGSTLI